MNTVQSTGGGGGSLGKKLKDEVIFVHLFLLFTLKYRPLVCTCYWMVIFKNHNQSLPLVC